VLNNAITQTEAKAVKLDGKKLQQKLLKKVEILDFAQLRRDVAPFLVHPEELSLLNAELMQQIIQNFAFSSGELKKKVRR
jgi:hypothetical protein